MSSALQIEQIKKSATKLAKKTSLKKPSEIARRERERIEEDSMRAELLNRQLSNKAFENIIELRKEYSKYILIFLIVWSFITLAIILLNAWSVYGFKLDSTVLSVLVGTCFGNVLALAGIVAKGIFLPPQKD